MKKLQKSLMKKGFIFTFILCMVAPISAFAATGTYNSYYDFTGGVFSKYLSMNSKKNITVSTYPDLNKTSTGANKINIELRKKGLLGDSIVDSSSNAARKSDSCTLTTTSADDYRVYYYGVPNGYRYYGDTTIKY